MALGDTSFGVTGACVGPFLSCGSLTPQGTPLQLTQEAGPGEGAGAACTDTGSPPYCGLCGPCFRGTFL